MVGTGAAYILQFDVVRGAGPVVASTITYLIPIVSVLLGVLVLGESLGVWELVGFAVVLAAAAVINAPARKAKTPEPPPSGPAPSGVAVIPPSTLTSEPAG